MKLYLSSYRLGNKSEILAEMFVTPQVALISNALDYSHDTDRLRQSEARELADLRSLHLEPTVLDLREYFGNTDMLRKRVQSLSGVWVRGGNTFILRKAFAQSGFDVILTELRSTQFVYAGYSAGACVLAPTLHGIHLADDPFAQADEYVDKPIWDGLGFIPYCIAPHYQSNHPESALIDQSVEYFKEQNIPFKTLCDGEVLIEEIE